MIWDIDKNIELTTIPHKNDYDVWVSRLTKVELQAIKDEIMERIAGDQVATAGWLPGSDWSNTPFHAIYEKACLFDQTASGKCFGLLVWVTLMEHDDYWAFGKYSVNNIPINSMTYFKIDPTRLA